MKKLLSTIAAVIGSAIAATILFAQVINQPHFQPGPRLIDGSALNTMLDTINNLTNYQYKSVTANPDTITVSDNVGIVVLDVSSGSITQETITTPAHPFNGQQLIVTARATVTTFALVANTGQTLASATPTTLAPSTVNSIYGYRWMYRASDAKWYRLQ